MERVYVGAGVIAWHKNGKTLIDIEQIGFGTND